MLQRTPDRINPGLLEHHTGNWSTLLREWGTSITGHMMEQWSDRIECLSAVARHEADRGAAYDVFFRVRLDIIFLAPVPLGLGVRLRRGPPCSVVIPLGEDQGHGFQTRGLDNVKASGLHWRGQPLQPDGMSRLSDAPLATALAQRAGGGLNFVNFNESEWRAFGVHDLRASNFVYANGTFFVPYVNESLICKGLNDRMVAANRCVCRTAHSAHSHGHIAAHNSTHKSFEAVISCVGRAVVTCSASHP